MRLLRRHALLRMVTHEMWVLMCTHVCYHLLRLHLSGRTFHMRRLSGRRHALV